MGKYITIQLPEEFVTQVIDPLTDQLKFGFSSRADVVKEGVRLLFEKYIGWNPKSEHFENMIEGPTGEGKSFKIPLKLNRK